MQATEASSAEFGRCSCSDLVPPAPRRGHAPLDSMGPCVPVLWRPPPVAKERV